MLIISYHLVVIINWRMFLGAKDFIYNILKHFCSMVSTLFHDMMWCHFVLCTFNG